MFDLISANDLVVLLIPILTFLASGLVNWLKAVVSKNEGGFGGTVLVTLIVPILSYVSSLIAEAVTNPSVSFWGMFGLGLASVFVNELIKQWTQTAKKAQTLAKKNLVG
jgi:hypothetical protein